MNIIGSAKSTLSGANMALVESEPFEHSAHQSTSESQVKRDRTIRFSWPNDLAGKTERAYFQASVRMMRVQILIDYHFKLASFHLANKLPLTTSCGRQGAVAALCVGYDWKPYTAEAANPDSQAAVKCVIPSAQNAQKRI